MAKKRAFVKYTKKGKIIPGSLIVTTNGGYPVDGLYKEVSVDLCCDDTNPCTPANYGDWKLVTGGVAGDGVVLVDPIDPEDCPKFTFIGPDDDTNTNDADDGWVYLKQYFASTTCFEIDYKWTSFDDSNPSAPPNVDWPVYWTSTTEPTGAPADATVRVSSTPANGTWNITVPGGKWFALGIYSSDSCCGRGFLTVEICEVTCAALNLET